MEKYGSVLNMVTVDSLVNAGAHYGHHKRYAVFSILEGTFAIYVEKARHERLFSMSHCLPHSSPQYLEPQDGTVSIRRA